MAVAYVPASSGAAAPGTTQYALAATVGTGVPTGAVTIIVAACGDAQVGPSAWTASDNVSGNTYVNITSAYDGSWNSVAIFAGYNIQNAPTQFTVGFGGGSAEYPAVTVDTFTGVATASPLDATGAFNEQPNPGGATNSIVSGSFTPSASGDLFYSACTASNGGGSVAAGTGWTLAQNNIEGALTTEYILSGGTGSTSGAFTDSANGGGQNYLTVTIALKSASQPAVHGTLSETLSALTSSTILSSTDKSTLSATLDPLTGPGASPGSWVVEGITYVPSASGTYADPDTVSLWQPTITEIPAGASVFVLMTGTLPTGSFETWQLTDNAGNTYVRTGYISDGNPGFATASYFCRAATGNPTSLSFRDVVFGSSVEYPVCLVDVFLGIPPTYVIDTSSNNLQPGPGLVTDSVTSGTLTTTQAGGFIWAATVPFSGLGPGIAIGTGWTAGQTGGYVDSEYNINTPLGAQAATFTPVSPNDQSWWQTAAIALKSEPFDGTVSQTLGNLGLYAPGIVEGGNYAVSETLGALALSATAAPTDKASVSDTLGALTVLATGILKPTRYATASDTLGSLTFSGGMASDDPGTLRSTLGALTATATLVWQEQYSASETLGSLALSSVLSPIDKLTISKTLGSLALVSTVHNFTPVHLTLSATLGSVTATFLTGKTKFTTVNPRTYLTVLGYQPGTPPIQNLQVG